MNFININTQETVIPSRIGNRDNVTWENSLDLLKSIGWRIRPDLPPIAEGYERLSIYYVDGYDNIATAIYTDTLIQDRLDAELQQTILDEQNRQLAKCDNLKYAENEFLKFCDKVTNTTTHIKLSIPQLETVSADITDELIAVKLELELLKINAKCILYGGVNWWEDCVWHEDVI